MLLALLLYAPVGLCLLVLRLFIGVHVFLVSCILPDGMLRRCVRAGRGSGGPGRALRTGRGSRAALGPFCALRLHRRRAEGRAVPSNAAVSPGALSLLPCASCYTGSSAGSPGLRPRTVPVCRIGPFCTRVLP